MAKKRDIIIGVIIVAVFIGAIGFFGMMFVGLMAQDGDFEISGLGGNIGIVEVYGVMDESLGRTAIENIERWTDNNSIKAIVIHINSGGGGAAISQEMYDAILRARDEKPVVTSMASVAASGGYYIACATDRIIANPGTLTGSIGVIFQYHTFEGLMQKVGVGTETVKSGELKDVGSYSRPMAEKEELMLRSIVMDTYEQFVSVVAEGRGKDVEEVYPLADGSLYTGLQAYNLGLVDTLGGLYEAVEIAAELAGLEGEPKIVRRYERKKITFFDLLGNVSQILSKPIENRIYGPQLLFSYE